MKCIAARSFTLGSKAYPVGWELELPANQFSDLSAVGLVKAAPKSVKPATKATTAELPNPGNVSSNDGAE